MLKAFNVGLGRVLCLKLGYSSGFPIRLHIYHVVGLLFLFVTKK